MKIKEAEELGNEISRSYDSSNVVDIPPQGYFRHGMIIRNISLGGDYSGFDFERPDFRQREKRARQNLSQYIEKLNASNKDYIVEIKTEEGRSFGKNVLYLSKIYDSNNEVSSYLCIQTPLTSTDATVNVLKSQFLIVSILIILISFALSFYISKRLAKPIIKIKDSSLELSQGNYSVAFEEGDYKEINELSRVLNYTANELSKNEELRRDLIANVSHDLKTPLTIIKSYAEMIVDISGDNKEKREEHLGVIVKETDRLTELVNDILDLSKIEAGTIDFEMEKFDIASTVKSVYEQFKVFSDYKNYSFSLECPDSLMAYGNELRINQVIYNLIGNAVNYTGEDNSISIRLFEREDKVRFEVKDTGKGISEEDKKRVWDRYYKISKTNKREETGSGIGLAIVKNILLYHNADFGVESELGKGSLFWFELDIV